MHPGHPAPFPVQHPDRAALADRQPLGRRRPGDQRHRGEGLGARIRRGVQRARPGSGAQAGEHRLHLGHRQHPGVEAVRPGMREPALEGGQIGGAAGQIGHARPRPAQTGPQPGGEALPDPPRVQHQRQFRRVAALGADPAPVAPRLLARHPPLLAQKHPPAPAHQLPARKHPRHAAADHHRIGGLRQVGPMFGPGIVPGRGAHAQRSSITRPSIAPLASNSLTDSHSSGWCAWAMSPGPQITAEYPCAWNWPPSVP